ncbi:MAG: PAS and helix-turn-helix domain-containing protein, partial [Deltaproteobacteria bacterium]|nr:PAS and helix-turn-helix domain-containing protein [Deltaproteobacteria bacterium]
KIIEANQRSTKVFGLSYDQLIGLNFSEFCLGENKTKLIKVVKELGKSQSWETELTGRQIGKHTFPMSVAINRVELETGAIIQILAKDITRQKELEQKLNHDKNQLQEVNITLRNVLESINDKNSEFQQEVSQTVQKSLLPVLGKIERETDSDIIKGYLHLMKDQLLKLAVTGEDESSFHFLKLSPTEVKICQFIQSGSATKEIAETLCLSVETIQTHRRNIRKKLGLRGRDVNLFSYLNVSAKTYPIEIKSS